MNMHRPPAMPVATSLPAVHTATAAAGAGPACFDSTTLFAGQRELLILHQGEQYRLRITRQEKLILTK